MLSYQHLYHAGNPADVLKHTVLTLVMQFLQRKEKPLRIFDTHAGSGLYDLESPEARKTAEYREGIGRLFSATDAPGQLSSYLALVRDINPDGRLRRYPGSPLIAAKLLRPDDHLELMELHPQALSDLRACLGGERRAHVHNRNGYEGLSALLPPRERRGLVLIDPSYEIKEEFRRVIALLKEGISRWATGCYAIWYPLLDHPAADDFLPRVAATAIPRIFRAELAVLPKTHPGMTGSGMLIVNPPWGMEEALNQLLPWLWGRLAAEGAGHWRSDWLTPET